MLSGEQCIPFDYLVLCTGSNYAAPIKAQLASGSGAADGVVDGTSEAPPVRGLPALAN